MTEVLTPEPTEIPGVLVPYDHYDPEALAQQLNSLVTASEDILSVRGLAGLVDRYSDPEKARTKVLKGRRETTEGTLGHFAIVDAKGAVHGSASIIPRHPLKKQKLALPPIFAKGTPVDGLDINVHAWTAGEQPRLLSDAYRELIDKADAWPDFKGPKIWTVEPVSSPKYIHSIIKTRGLQEVETARFDDGESRRKVPGISTLYARDYKEWLPPS